MRLWHQDLIPKLPNAQLLGQHRECCALRGKGWGKKHSTVDYVFTHPYHRLFIYHTLIMLEMKHRGYKVNPIWLKHNYRGKNIGYDNSVDTSHICKDSPIYPEHNEEYLQECINNLKEKGVEL